jgi:ribosomal protein S18 acetylase RimI-like enzyme
VQSRPPAALRLRRIRPEEHDDVGAITVAAYEPFTRGPGDPALARLADTAARDRDAEVWVAVDDAEALLGSVTHCPPGSPWREVAIDGEGEFRMLSVAPAAQGRGVGEALVGRCLDRARAEGQRAVVLSSLPQMAAAHRLYGRLGFTRAPERDWEPVPGVRLIGFRRDLEDGT